MENFLNKTFFKNFWYLVKSYWQSEEKKSAFFLLLTIIILSLAQVYVLVLFNKWYNTFYTSLQDYNNAAIIMAVKEFAIIAAIHITMAIYSYYLQKKLQLKWRAWMTKKYVVDWTNTRTYYLLELFEKDTDNPDQRISEDIRLFVEYTLTLVLGLIKNAVIFISFISILWTLSGDLDLSFIGINFVIPKFMVWVTFIYAIVGTYFTDKIGRILGRYSFEQQKYEANFRFSMIRLRENCENIAFYEGEDFERKHFANRFSTLLNNLWLIIRKQKQVIALTASYSQIAVIVPLIINVPRYLIKEINLGVLMQISTAFGRVQDALSFIVDMYLQIVEWQVVVTRLTTFDKHMKDITGLYSGGDILKLDHASEKIVLDDITVKLPSNQRILNNLSISFLKSSKWLIQGASGVGKSTLLRVVSGLWPYVDGKIYYSDGKKMFLPQRTYLPLGTLREVLLYPGNISVEDDEIISTLKTCNLSPLVDKLDEIKDWSKIFSLGEQQRIAFVRVLLHKPLWLFLDEATSAMDEDLESKMYTLVKEYLPETAIISVGHRSSLNAFHENKLILTGAGHWVID